PMTPTPSIQLDAVVKRYGRVTAVDGISLTVAKGEALTVFGPNGAGKTTLLRMIAGLARPTGGRVAIGGVDVTHGHHDEVRRQIGYISHQGLTYGQLTARENLHFFAKLYGAVSPDERAEELLARVGLASRADDLVQTFSRGMKQRLSIARALVHDPQVVLLDEPFTGLDQHAADMLRRELSTLTSAGKTVVMITHNLKVGVEMSHRVTVQVAGKIRVDLPTAGLDPVAFGATYFDAVGGAHY
ncbi:MAG: heme ABC exporter ATP-binding protein CcmA, partial [Nitrospinae bacterium]|nr:heme ABC exporter ATP-binding protein CcmA [Nitrospinota bacterium]